MMEQGIKLLLLPGLFSLGLLLAATRRLNTAHADRLLTWIVNGVVPALILGSLLPLPLQSRWVLLPLCAGMLVALFGLAALGLARALRLPRHTTGSFIVASMIMNVSVIYPFLTVFKADQAVALLAVFDFGQALLVFTLVYAIACVYGGHHWDTRVVGMKLLTFPPNVALAAVLLIKAAGVSLPLWITDTLLWIGKWGVFGILIALGVYFSWERSLLRLALLHIFSRAALGAACAWVLQHSLSLTPEMSTIVWVAALAPLGFNAIVFAGREAMDKSYAAAAVSLSLLAGMVYIPIMLLGFY